MQHHYISPRFLDKLAVHITKNFLELPSVKVPLILGIHGRKGEGKSYQCELVFDRMGIEAVRMSAGELESPDAGDPSRLIRLRYREAAELIRVRGRMAVLLINDLDAGAGRIDHLTQYTVNTQLVHGTLMNIADNPTDVQLPGSYDETPLNRVPILVTGNDFSTLYAPLIRDGRMDKFYWEPDRDDRIGIVNGIFVDALSQPEVGTLVDTFADQAIDFFSALRSRLYDDQIRQFIHQIGIDKVASRLVNSAETPPEFPQPSFSLPHLLDYGKQMVAEQQRVKSMRLVEEYLPHFQNHNHSNARPGGRNRFYAKHPDRDFEDWPHTSAPALPDANANGENPTYSTPTHQHLNTHLSAEISQSLEQIIQQGYRIGIEYVDARRFRMNSWQCYATLPPDRAQASNTLVACLAEHPQDYIRLVGIEPQAKRRMIETIVQRPLP